MKLHEITETRKVKGTYVGVKFDDETRDSLVKYMGDAKIPNMIPANDLHSTLIYSRKECPNYKAASNVNMIGTPDEFVVWDTQADDTGKKARCLVLKFDCEEMVKKHNQIRKEHGATHDYDKLNTHVTLSYDIGDMDISTLPDIKKYVKRLVINKEYVEPLDLDWVR